MPQRKMWCPEHGVMDFSQKGGAAGHDWICDTPMVPYTGQDKATAEKESTRSVVIGIIAQNVDDKFLVAHELEDGVTFDAMGADSIDKLEMIIECETALNIEIGDEESEGLKSVGDLIAMCERKVAP